MERHANAGSSEGVGLGPLRVYAVCMCRLASAVSALIALLGLALPTQAAPAPIVCDFENGL